MVFAKKSLIACVIVGLVAAGGLFYPSAGNAQAILPPPDAGESAQAPTVDKSMRGPMHIVGSSTMQETLTPEVVRVMHPALAGHPGHDLWKRDHLGSSGLFGVVLEPVSEKALAAMLDGMELFGMGASWGGYESLMIPTDPAHKRVATQWTVEGQVLRIHAGLEDPDDLIADLERGFERLNRAS